jgi:hypothetical protein
MKRNVNGIDVEIPDTIVAVFDSAADKAVADSKAVADKATKAVADLDAANGTIAALTKEIESNRAEIKRVTDVAYIDASVKDRLAVIETAKKIAPAVVCDALSTDAIKRAVVESRLNVKLEGATADYVNGAFSAFRVAPVVTDSKPVVDALNAGINRVTLDSIHAAFVKRNNGEKE